MTGEELFGFYQAYAAQENVTMDGWEEMEPWDQTCWDKLAKMVGPEDEGE